jgi:hypothetical protein
MEQVMDHAEKTLLSSIEAHREYQKVMDAWAAYRTGKMDVGTYYYTLLTSHWDYTDPADKADKLPLEIQLILEEYPYHKDIYYDNINPGHRNMLDMFKDMYRRWYICHYNR